MWLMRVLLLLLLSVLALYMAACGALYGWQRALLYFPQPAGQPVDALMLPVDGATLHVSVRSLPGAPALLYFGGNAEDVSGTLARLARLMPDHALYLMHYRGYGYSSGSPTEEALHADALALHEHVLREHAVIKVVGRSLGSSVAVRLASRQRVDRLLLITPFDSVEAVATAQFPWLPVRWLIKDRFDSAAWAARIKVPTTLLVAANDSLIRPEHSARLLAHFQPGVATRLTIAQTDHNDIALSPEYERALAGALR